MGLARESATWQQSLERGHQIEARIRSILVARGYRVIPTSALLANTSGTMAPMAESGDGKIVLPDNIVAAELMGNVVIFCPEVKGKTKPVYFRIRHRFEHGIDYASLQHYRAFQDAFPWPVHIVISEREWPLRATPDGPWLSACENGGEENLLHASLNEVLEWGIHNPKAPGFQGGSFNWPRDRMHSLAQQSLFGVL